MKKFVWILVLLIYTSCFVLAEEENNGTKNNPVNPLFFNFNQIIDFESLTADNIKDATNKTIADAKTELNKIYSIKKEDRTFDNTMLAVDNIYNHVNSVFGVVYLMGNVQVDESKREQANEDISVFSKFLNEVGLDENLYHAVKDYSMTEEAKNLTGYKKKFLTETVLNFERNGFALSKEKRDELKVFQDKISDLSLEFQKNIAEDNGFIIMDESDLEGLPEDYKEARKTDDGKYKIDLSYPSYQPFMKYAKSEKARKNLYIKYNNRAADKNLILLKQVLIEREKMAKLLGYDSYARYQVEDKMAKTPEAVWKFETNLTDKVKEKAKKDYDELLEVKKDYLNDNNISIIQPWEASFYNNLLLEQKYDLDQNEVKEYFELNNVLDGLFQIAQHLFDVKFEEIKDASVWQKDVRAFNVIENGKVISRFYLDLFPRPNKYSHAACFPMISGKETINGYQMPTATLVCNFPAPTKEVPSLMPHSDVETFFHEFGHVLHNVLTKAKLSSFSGTNVARDFVEAPSQIFENWAWNYDALKLFTKNYKTGKVMPKELFDKMLAAKNVGSGLATLQQIFYGTLDMTYHDKYDPEGNESTTEVVKRLQNAITLYPYLEGTNFQAAFGHLMGYSAGYYGYLWSLVYAQDMFSVFEKNGVMDEETGIRYRNIILAKGGSEKEIDLVKEFLGREPNENAFLKSLGL
ncbi:MAG: M3 family metallopeptidase [Ignavibacteriaceae bacterium]